VLSGVLASGCRGGGVADETTGLPVPRSTISLELIATIGCADCDGPEQITPTAMALFDDGRLAVLDRYAPFVRIFAPDGEFLRSFGSPGQGPGELGNDVGGMYFAGVFLLPWPSGELSVLELMPAVVETFSAGGKPLWQQALELPMAAPAAQAFAPGTGTYFRHSYLPLSDLPDVIERCVIDPAGDAECGQLMTATELTGTPPEGARAGLAAAATPQGDLVVADLGTYRLWVLNAEGEVVRQFGRDIPPPPKSQEELEAERAANRQRRERGREEREIDPDRPHISPAGVQVDGAGRVWTRTMRYTTDSTVFDVFDDSGIFLHEISLPVPTLLDPNQITPFVAVGDRLAAIEPRPDGSARINVYRIVTN